MESKSSFVSRVVNGLKAITKDDHISQRYILSIGVDKAKKIIGQKLSEMRLTKEDIIFTTIECVKMERITYKDCGVVEFKTCDKLVRSCKKIPELMYSRFGPVVLSMTSIDGSKTYTYRDINQYNRSKKLKYRRGGDYFYMKDGHVLIPDSKVELVDMTVLTLDDSEAYQLSACTDEKGCRPKMEHDFICPDRHLDTVVQDTINEIANFYRTSVADENPNMDSNQKSKTVV